MLDALRVNDDVVIPAADLSWSAVRSSGPGGQNVNKVASKVVLVLELATTHALPAAAKARLRALGGFRVDALGRLHVTSQLTRDQHRNLEDARDKLRELVARALIAPKPRKPTKPTRGSKRRRLEDKRRRGGDKALRRRVGTDD